MSDPPTQFRWDFRSAPAGAFTPEARYDQAGFGDRLEILGRLGKGGMGEVFRARDLDLNREVAVKVLSRALDPTNLARFMREAELTAALQHPSIVGIHWAGVTEEGRPFLVLDLIEDAEDLAAAFGARFAIERVELLLEVARAVAFLHENGVVHRDLKPENVLIDASGRPHLCDLGLARHFVQPDRLTQTGATLGTPLYMAPEQFDSQVKAGGDARLDVWALGVLLYEALTGRHPFYEPGLSLAELMCRITVRPVAPNKLSSDVTPEQSAVCLRAMHPDRSERFEDALALVEAMEAAAGPERRGARAPWILGATAAGLLFIGAVALLPNGGREDALQSVDTPASLTPSDAPPTELAPAPVPEAVTAREHFNRGEACLREDDPQAAYAAFDRALALDPDFVLALVSRAATRTLLGDLEGAEADFSRAIDVDPNHAAAYSGRGSLKQQAGRLEAALVDLSRAVDLDPGASMVFHNRGLARRSIGDLEGASADLTQAIELDASSAMSYNARGLVRRDRGDLEGALADHDQAIALDPNSALALNNRGGAKLALGDLGGALADFERAISIAPRHAMGYVNRGIISGQRGDLQGAVADFDHALSLEPTSVLAYLNRAFARMGQGDREGAIADYEAVLRHSRNPRERARVEERLAELRADRGK